MVISRSGLSSSTLPLDIHTPLSPDTVLGVLRSNPDFTIKAANGRIRLFAAGGGGFRMGARLYLEPYRQGSRLSGHAGWVARPLRVGALAVLVLLLAFYAGHHDEPGIAVAVMLLIGIGGIFLLIKGTEAGRRRGAELHEWLVEALDD